MHRFISLLLIPFFVLGQGLPHAHAGTGVAAPDRHAARPHVHWSGHDHGHHDHDVHAAELESAGGCSLLPSSEHDSDAVYLAASTGSATRLSGVVLFDVCSLNQGAGIASLDNGLRMWCRCGDPPDRFATLPIYLLTASLRL